MNEQDYVLLKFMKRMECSVPGWKFSFLNEPIYVKYNL